MKYTLDSLKQIEVALGNEFKDSKITYEAVIKSGDDLLEMTENPKIVYFGVLTLHDDNNAVMSYRGNDIIKVDAGSQIIECFSALAVTDLTDVPAVNSKGLFRGFIIQILS